LIAFIRRKVYFPNDFLKIQTKPLAAVHDNTAKITDKYFFLKFKNQNSAPAEKTDKKNFFKNTSTGLCFFIFRLCFFSKIRKIFNKNPLENALYIFAVLNKIEKNSCNRVKLISK
jgi:hypothetical protein